jgi:Fe-S oxidoreductase
VAPEKLGGYLRDFSELVTKQFKYPWTVFGHFGQGCIHARIGFDLKTKEGVAKFRRFLETAADLVISYGGSLSGEHGDGQARAELLPKMYGPKLIEAFREFKSIWDPEHKMNPGKLVDPNPLDRDIRVGPDYHARPVFTKFKFPHDKGSLALATERCFGVGKCRSLDGDTMCPSFHATREEKHTTRGRAHLLFEMLRGDSILNGWRDDGVKEALDLCLSCKGCKHDCPVSVDMATYKSEFLSHYWEGRLRPRSAYALGLVNVWMRAASIAPGLANLITQSPVLRDFAKFAAAMPKQRSIPAIAPRTFRARFASIPRTNGNGRSRVLLWPDTFNNYFHPEVALAGADVLEAAGFDVSIPRHVLCCGRPLYDFGMLDRAKKYLKQVLGALHDEIAAGVPLIFLEPGCAAVFRDEMLSLMPDDEDAKRLSEQSFLLSEFLTRKATHFELPNFSRKAVVHGHCHHKSILKFDAENEVMDKLGLEYEVLDSGCCGMAGSFGFEEEKYPVSVACGERVLLPAVREADPKTLIMADGFSCREQIAQMTNRRGLHLAQVIQMALRQKSGDQPQPFSEADIVAKEENAVRVSMRRTGALLAGAAAIGGAAWILTRRSA